MKKKILLITSLLISANFSFAQEDIKLIKDSIISTLHEIKTIEPKEIVIKGNLNALEIPPVKPSGIIPNHNFSFEAYGWVTGQYFFDTRQMVDGREGLLSLYPKPEVFDAKGNDLNSRYNSNFNLSASRIGLKIFSERPVLGAKTVGVLEADFTGQADANIHLFRLRQAHVTMQWENTKLLFGHTWSPLFVAEMFPGMQDLHNGGPFHPFSRTNQIRLDQQLEGGLKFIGTIGWQRDYTSIGVDDKRSPMNQINSNLPEVNVFFHYKYEGNGNNFFAGIGGEYKALKPRLEHKDSNNITYKQNTLLHSYSATAFLNYSNKNIDIKFQGIWGQNLNDYMMLGGFVESKYYEDENKFYYLPTTTANFWLDVSYPRGKWRPALFLGYLKTLEYSPTFEVEKFYGSGYDKDANKYVSNIFRVAPRLDFFANPNFFFTLQAEYTAAAYGTWQKNTGKVLDAEYIGNYRFSLAFCYKFNTGKRVIF